MLYTFNYKKTKKLSKINSSFILRYDRKVKRLLKYKVVEIGDTHFVHFAN